MKKELSQGNERRKNVTVNIPKHVAKAFSKRIKSGEVAGAKITKTKVINKEVIFFLEFDTIIDANSLNIGYQLNEQKYKAAALVKAAELKKQDIDEVPKELCLTFAAEIRKEFVAHCKDRLKIVRAVADITGKQTKYYFDISDVKTSGQLVKRIEEILDAVQSIKQNERLRHAQEYMDIVIADLLTLPSFKQGAYMYSYVTGKELIEMGECTVFDSSSKPAKIFQKFLNILFGKYSRKFDYLYFGKLVELDKEYIVLHDPKNFESPQPIDHKYNVLTAFRYGEQVFEGNGVIEVEQYYKGILKSFNLAIKEKAEQANG